MKTIGSDLVHYLFEVLVLAIVHVLRSYFGNWVLVYCWSLSENLTVVSSCFGLIYRRYFVVDVVLGSALGSCTFVIDFAVETNLLSSARVLI